MGNSKLEIKKIEKSDVSTRLYCGMSADGFIRIRTDGHLGYYFGEIYIPKQEVSNGVPKSVRKPFRATKGFTHKTPAEQFFPCYGRKTGRLFWANVVPVPTPVKRTKTDKTLSTNRKAGVLQALKKAKRTSSSYVDAIAAQKEAGLDPDVRMAFIVNYVGESRANLYKKMGKEFPKPTKRGRGSFWPLSVIDAYKASRSGVQHGQ